MTKAKEDKLSRLDAYNFTTSSQHIAQYPLSCRDSSKLLIRQSTQLFEDRFFSNIPEALPKKSLIVLNDTKVFSCRLFGKKETGAVVEVFLLEKPYGKKTCECTALAKPMRKLQVGTRLCFDSELSATIVAIWTEDERKLLRLQFNRASEWLMRWLQEYGDVPLPPYIRRARENLTKKTDLQRYQTLFAQQTGSVAAPTAGLHFTTKLFEQLSKRDIEIKPITLHVGLGTFASVKTNCIKQHNMHKERFFVPQDTLKAILKAKEEKRQIIAVGTTTFRALESLFHLSHKDYQNMLMLCNKWLETDLFIHPCDARGPYVPWAVNGLITNFHQPQSTLFMLVCALIGFEEAHDLYQYALNNKYRFYSYGDASLLWLGNR